MERNPELGEFSDEHRWGLVQARQLRRAAWGKGEDPAEAAEAFLEFWQKEDSVHLRKEEEVLLPVMVRNGVDLGQELATRMLTQHAQLRGLAAELDDQVVREEIHPETLWDLGETLEAHIHMQERELFPLIEEALPKGAFEEVSSRLEVFGVGSHTGTVSEPPAVDEDPPCDFQPDVGLARRGQRREGEARGVAREASGLGGGEHWLQERYGTEKQAQAFYDKQMLDHLNPSIREFIAQQEMLFVGTADSHGECDCSFRSGVPGFARVLDENTLIYPELKGNGVMASLGNISENPHVGIMFIGFFESTVGLQVNGKASIVENDELLERSDLPEEIRENVEREDDGSKALRWVVVEVEEAYVQCAKHIPLVKKLDKEIHWGTDDESRKRGGFFEAKDSPRPWGADS